ncbi:MAG: GTPase Era [Acidobacteriia bacterium]|nr:GTPase Era [Terriglobia bacterium]
MNAASLKCGSRASNRGRCPVRKAKKFVSGFVSILGRPNAGKSTLINALVGSKVAIVSPKPQTTRQTVQAVVSTSKSQVVFLDTPGVHEGNLLVHRRMMDQVRQGLQERDLLLWMADATLPLDSREKAALALVANSKTPVFLVLNKIDRIRNKQQLLPLIEEFAKVATFQESIPISALKGEGLDQLMRHIVNLMPAGPQYFPPDFLTDQPERYLAGELIREKILYATRQEVPHSVAVLVEQWEEKTRLTRIAAAIYVDRDTHKRIIIGSGGDMLKKIGTLARQEMESLFGRKIFLELFVKVQPKWRDSPDFLNELDWRYMAGGQEK